MKEEQSYTHFSVVLVTRYGTCTVTLPTHPLLTSPTDTSHLSTSDLYLPLTHSTHTPHSYLLVLKAQLVVELLEVLPELLLPVASAQCDLKHLTPGGEGCQSGHTLPTTAPHPDQQGVALVHADHTMDAGEVLQGIVK